jgi:hypothetical protein
MDALVLNVSVTGHALVKTVAALMPGSNVALVLDLTNDIIVQRVVNCLKPKKFTTVFHLVQAVLSYEQSEENSIKVMRILANDHELKSDIEKFIESGLINSVSKFVEKKKCWCF